MHPDPYPIISIQPEWVLESEAMGSKDKFWYRESKGEHEEESDWLFKYARTTTGEYWAEKIAAEVAHCLKIYHARVELAEFQGDKGSTTESFARDGRELVHGNQVMAGAVSEYDPETKFRQSKHTLENIWLAIDKTFVTPDGAVRAKTRMAEYLVLDAIVGNTDRHHENWGLLRKRSGEVWKGSIAPSFDHASSLGRELLDEARQRLLAEHRVGKYAEKAPGAIFLKEDDRRGASPLTLVRYAAVANKEIFRPALEKVHKLDLALLGDIVERVPPEWMSAHARQFALDFMCYSVGQLREVPI
jgi:hypothetical protein